MDRKRPKDSLIRQDFDFYADQLGVNGNNPQMLRGLAEHLRAGLLRLESFAAQTTCPDAYINSPRVIGLLPVAPQEWWDYYRPIVQGDLVIVRELLQEYENKI